MQIITDHKWKPFRFRDEVPAKVLADQFDHLDPDDTDGFICYRGHWYHTSDFLRLDTSTPESAFAGWHASAADTYFSAILIKIARDGETYQIARAYS